MFEVFIKQFGRILRYFSAPLVGLSVVYILDENGDVFYSLIRFERNNEAFTSWWPLIFFSFIFGVTIYSLHRALIHSWLNPLIIWATIKKKRAPSMAATLDRARAHRESDASSSAAHAYQMRLNNSNSTCHFLWCSAWSIWLIPAVLSFRFYMLAWKSQWHIYCIFSLPLIAAAIITQFQTTEQDFWAYQFYTNHRGQESDFSGNKNE